MKEEKCLRCGKCCYYFKYDLLHKCRFLKLLDGNKTECEIYDMRLDKPVGVGEDFKPIICVGRDVSKNDYPGCPLNSGKPLLYTEEQWQNQKSV